MGRSKAKNIFFILLILFPSFLMAQKTAAYAEKNKDYTRALDLFEKEKYSAAEEVFDQVYNRIEDPADEIKVNADYYAAVCALKLFNRDAAYRLTHFIEKYPESPKVQAAYFQLGRYYFKRRHWDDVQLWLKKVNKFNLDERQLSEYYFRRGYADFMLKHYDEATSNFYNIKDDKNPYQTAAIYYYAYISYIQGSYQTAYDNFQELKDDAKFGPIVPYYITQILYLQKHYKALVDYAPRILKSAEPQRVMEITRLVGNAYYELKDYKQAVTYLLDYQQHQTYPKRTDAYQLGYAYLQADEYKKAENWLKKVSNKRDSLNQVTYYNLGIAYLKSNEKRDALNAFRSAADMSQDDKLAQDALFNYAKISYDISYQPYNAAVIAFKNYIEKYPNSPQADKAYAYLIGVFSTTKNYQAALDALSDMNHKTLKLKMAEQRLNYFRGVELYNNRNYKAAIKLFSRAIEHTYDRNFQLNSYYWLAQSNYHLKNYDDAIQTFNKFINLPGAINSKWYDLIDYNLGYSYFQKKDWSNSLLWYRKFIASDNAPKLQQADAMNRIADAYYMKRDFKNAIYYYDKAAMLNKIDVDYALYQSAIANGVVKKFQDKESLLLTLINGHKNSPYIANAYYQLGINQLQSGKNKQALKYFNLLVKKYPKNQYIDEAMLKTGLIYFNAGQDNEALKEFKMVVEQFPNSKSSHGALQHIQRIYVDNGKVEEYRNYIKTVPFAKVSNTSLDSVAYQAAAKFYFEDNCDEAVKHFNNYLGQYPDGIYTLNVHFYRGDCAYRAGDTSLALKDFTKVLSYPTSKYTESALEGAAKINFTKGNKNEALEQYAQLEKTASHSSNILEAQKALLDLNFDFGNYQKAMHYADTLLKVDKIDDLEKEKAILIKAKSANLLGQQEIALENFKQLEGKNDKYAAEAIYNISLIQFKNGDYEKSEETVYKLINDLPSYDYWVAKGFILLSDNYLSTQDSYRAKQTLEMLISNYKGEKLLKVAKEKLKSIEKKEQEKEIQQKEQKTDTVQININSLDSGNNNSKNKIKKDSAVNE